MNALIKPTTAEKISELQRELDMRRRVYTRDGRPMSRKNARQIEIMEAILEDYQTRALIDPRWTERLMATGIAMCAVAKIPNISDSQLHKVWDEMVMEAAKP